MLTKTGMCALLPMVSLLLQGEKNGFALPHGEDLPSDIDSTPLKEVPRAWNVILLKHVVKVPSDATSAYACVVVPLRLTGLAEVSSLVTIDGISSHIQQKGKTAFTSSSLRVALKLQPSATTVPKRGKSHTRRAHARATVKSNGTSKSHATEHNAHDSADDSAGSAGMEHGSPSEVHCSADDSEDSADLAVGSVDEVHCSVGDSEDSDDMAVGFSDEVHCSMDESDDSEEMAVGSADEVHDSAVCKFKDSL